MFHLLLPSLFAFTVTLLLFVRCETENNLQLNLVALCKIYQPVLIRQTYQCITSVYHMLQYVSLNC